MDVMDRRFKSNVNFPEFSCTTYEERVDVFGKMKNAVHSVPNEIPFLSFNSSCTSDSIAYLTASEQKHLLEVSHLVDKIEIIAGLFVLLWLSSLVVKKAFKRCATNPIHDVIYLTGFAIAGTLLLKFFGARELYILAHELYFPADDQSGYMVSESIMVVLMSGADFFYFIFLSLVLTAGAILSLSIFLEWLSLQRRTTAS